MRCLTIGYEYIERGGRDGKVYASFLVKGGVYSHTRNPMYLGNALIAIGLLLYSGAYPAIFAGIPFFLFVYLSITAAEEHYLSGRFGDDYRAYCGRVNRFFPPVGALFRTVSAMTYDGRKGPAEGVRDDLGGGDGAHRAAVVAAVSPDGAAGRPGCGPSLSRPDRCS